MKLKKWLLGLITFAAMVVMCAVCAGAETYGDFEYDVLDDGTVEITDYNGSAEKVDIPEKIDGRSVTGIGYSAFEYCSNITSVTIPNGVTSIGNHAFFECEYLKSITIPNGVTSIGDYAFFECINLTSVEIPDGLIIIGFSAFNGCASLKSIALPGSAVSIGSYAFSSCTSLTEIKVSTENSNYVSINGVLYNRDKTIIKCYPAGKEEKAYEIIDGVTSIDYGAFNNCTSLTSINIPNSVADIRDNPFGNCASLTEIKVASENPNYVSVNGVLYNKDKTTIICYPAGKEEKNYTIIDGATSIANSAFCGCEDLTSVSIPDSVTSIGNGAFSGCINLTYITIPDSVTSIGYWVFMSCTNLKSITIPGSLTIIGRMDFYYCTSLTNVTIPDGVTEIENLAFYSCTSLTSITIPASVKTIGNEAFGYYNGEKKLDNFKIYCYSGTAGEQYAKDNGFAYELLADKPTLAKVTGVKLGGRAADALRINWTKNTNADGYIVEMYQNGKWVRVAKITNNSTTTFRKAGLKAGTVYKFRVKAYKMYDITAAYSEYSATVAARTNPSVMKGAKLTGRAADALRINWTKNASADGYIVEMHQGNKWVRVAKITNNSTTTFRKAGLKASTVYKFRVRAYKMSGKTALYGNYSATVTARTNPSVMKGVKIAGKAKDALRVNWTKNTSAQGYIVEMYKGGKWVRVAKITNGNTTTYRKAGLAKNTAYKFRVRAYHMSGKTALYGNYGSVSGKTTAK